MDGGMGMAGGVEPVLAALDGHWHLGESDTAAGDGVLRAQHQPRHEPQAHARPRQAALKQYIMSVFHPVMQFSARK